MSFFKFISVMSSTVAGLCVLALPMWALGVPGVENQYAKGWKMGLNVLLVYPVACLLIYAPYLVMRNRMAEENRSNWQATTGYLALVILLAAIFRMFQAFRTMR